MLASEPVLRALVPISLIYIPVTWKYSPKTNYYAGRCKCFRMTENANVSEILESSQ